MYIGYWTLNKYYYYYYSQLLRPSGQQFRHSRGSAHKSRGDNVVRMWVQLKRLCVLQRGHSGVGCVLALTLCKYTLRKGDLFVLSWAMVRRVRRGSISSDLLMCGGGVRSILLLPFVARCLDTIYLCIWRMLVFMSIVVTVWGSGNICCVAAVVENSGPGVLKYSVCLCRGCDGCCVFCLYCGP